MDFHFHSRVLAMTISLACPGTKCKGLPPRIYKCPGTKCKGLLPRVQIFRFSHRKASPSLDLIGFLRIACYSLVFYFNRFSALEHVLHVLLIRCELHTITFCCYLLRCSSIHLWLYILSLLSFLVPGHLARGSARYQYLFLDNYCT